MHICDRVAPAHKPQAKGVFNYEDIFILDLRKLFETTEETGVTGNYSLICNTKITNREDTIKCVCGNCIEKQQKCTKQDFDIYFGIADLFDLGRTLPRHHTTSKGDPIRQNTPTLASDSQTNTQPHTQENTNTHPNHNANNIQIDSQNPTDSDVNSSNNAYSTIKLAHWNMYGVTDANWSFKKQILLGTDAEIICVNETQFKPGKTVSMEGYTMKFHNRSKVNKRAKKGFGGVGIFIKNTVYEQFEISFIDQERDDILGMRMKDRISEKDIIIYSVYITPHNSTAGAPAHEMYTHLLTKSYEFNLADVFLIAGDLNSRLGAKEDFIELLDPTIPKRQILDFEYVKRNGEPFIEYLNESVSCVLNGRFDKKDNNFTCIRNGESVVDWFVTPITNFKWFRNFKVHTIQELIQKHNLASQIEKTSDVSDHSVITTEIIWSTFDLLQSNKTTTTPLNKPAPICTPKIHRKMPSNFLESQMATKSILMLIDKQMEKIENQRQVDELYKHFLTVFFEELDNLKLVKNSGPPKKRNKPWWCDELQKLWNEAVKSEKDLKNVKNSKQKREKSAVHKLNKQKFDRKFKHLKAAYKRKLEIELEEKVASDPNEFWNQIKNLGPKRQKEENFEVYDENGKATSDIDIVLKKWEQCTKDLFDEKNDPIFDNDFLNTKMEELTQIENDNHIDPALFLNQTISLDEVAAVVDKAKNGKAVGPDLLPYECMKNNKSKEILTSLFEKIFRTCLAPTLWLRSLIKPIPKGSHLDQRLPGNFRSISLISNVGKLFTGIINKRISTFLETNNLLVDEQNGFRSKRSCEDHVFALSSVLNVSKSKNQDVYACFVDFMKAFDSVHHKLLLYKLNSIGINGTMYNMIKAMYTNATSAVQIKNFTTNWFPIKTGIRQGDSLSPTLFAIFINDLAIEIKEKHKGVKLNENLNVPILLYADDIILLATSANELKNMIKTVYNWCIKWRLKVNSTKTKIMHFRGKKKPLTEETFYYGYEKLEIVHSYKYLGTIFDEHTTFEECAKTLSKAAGRKLGHMFVMNRKLEGIGYKTYTRLYESRIDPVALYAASIWGAKNFKFQESVQNKAMRLFLGVSRYTTNIAVQGDMGWPSVSQKVKIAVFRYWNRLINMSNTRLTKKIFLHEIFLKGKKFKFTWSSQVRKILRDLYGEDVQTEHFMGGIDLAEAKTLLSTKDREHWDREVKNFPKLRTYATLKTSFGKEPYVDNFLSKNRRSLIAQIRTGTSFLRVETGRYERQLNDDGRWEKLPIEKRVCKICGKNEVEDELHFLLKCQAYTQPRAILRHQIEKKGGTYSETKEMLKHLLSDKIFLGITADFLQFAMELRKE